MSSFTHYYGIDVSKDTLDILELTNQSQKKEQVVNQYRQLESWVKTLSSVTCFCIVEATGTYSSTLVYLLDQYQIQVAVVSPYKSKSFMDALGVSNKTDEQAAYCLARMGQSLELKPYKMPSMDRQKRKQLQTAHTAMLKQSRMLKNQLHALDQLPFVDQVARAAYEQTLQTIELQIQQIEEQLAALDEDEKDEEYQNKKALVSSVVGIGQTTAEAMLLAANCFETFQSVEELSKYFGLTPNSHYSGSSVRKRGKISKFGAPYVRGLLYMCSRSAIQHNNACKAIYKRLRSKGKPHKVAAVAVMHKLIKQVFACVKNQTEFDNDYYLKYETN